jgi:5-enolpyruvylshikimate-3-phosphate synthase
MIDRLYINDNYNLRCKGEVDQINVCLTVLDKHGYIFDEVEGILNIEQMDHVVDHYELERRF